MQISMRWTGRLQRGMRPASQRPSSGSAVKHSSGWLLAILLMAGCHSPIAIQDSRMPQPLDKGGWRVSDGFLQDRYQIERALRGQLERCEADLDARGARP